jgi:UDP-N-acetylglucosamine 2-epimerase (non-hydrolysing)
VRIVTIVGARPQFVKCAPLSKVLRKSNEEILVHTGQHYDFEMSRVFFEELDIPEPDYNLEVGSGSHAHQTAGMLASIEEVLVKERPDLTIVFGDTNSTLAGGLAACKLHIPVAHVEAGLRSYDRRMPEEINRVMTDHLSTLLFAPTRLAVTNLKAEGVVRGVRRVGDVMVDALESAKATMRRSKAIERLGLEEGKYVLLTVHRASNTDDPKNLAAIIRALSKSGMPVVFPVHPRTKKVLETTGIGRGLGSNVMTVPPLGYVEALRLMDGADAVVTDSGGMQKEAFLLGIRCLTLRDVTEWPETLTGEMNTLVGASEKRILAALGSRPKRRVRSMPFGTPGAADRIADVLERWRRSPERY